MVNLSKVAEYDFALIIDASGSMNTKDVKRGWFGTSTRWDAIANDAVEFAKQVEKVDRDGIGLVLFSDCGATSFNNMTSKDVAGVFRSNSPGGGTPLAEGITAGINLLKGSKKKKFLAVFTDGVPNSQSAVKKVIIDQANSQATDDELTILFVQVGNDKGALEYLRGLDDNLREAKFDIVDTKTAEEAATFPSIMDLVVHAIGD